MGWRNDALLVYTVLEDCDIYNDEREFNALSFLRGDVFEIFLRPAVNLALARARSARAAVPGDPIPHVAKDLAREARPSKDLTPR